MNDILGILACLMIGLTMMVPIVQMYFEYVLPADLNAKRTNWELRRQRLEREADDILNMMAANERPEPREWR